MPQPFPEARSRPLRDYPWFWGGFALLWLIGLSLALTFREGEEIFWFDHRRNALWDAFFLFSNRLGETPMFIGGLLLLLTYRFRSALVWPFMLFTVSLVSHYTKEWFAQPRPSLFFQQGGVMEQLHPLDGVILNGGLTSFPSGHTMVAFCMFGFLLFNWPSRHWGWQLFFLLLATLVGLARIYLIQHFLKDVVLGSLLGVMIAVVWYHIQWLWARRADSWWDKGLGQVLAGR